MRTKILLVLLIGFLAVSICSCNSDVTGSYAPSNISGKIMTVTGTSAGTLRIAFTSNNAATITKNDGKKMTFSSISYSKSNATSATVRINGIYIDFGASTATDNENLSLIFASPNQGVVNGNYSRRWNDGSTMTGTIEYESFTLF